MVAGKIAPDISPVLNVVISVTLATSSGPNEHPISPATEKSAKIAVPPAGNFFAPKLKTTGHITPSEKPQIPHPKRFMYGFLKAVAVKKLKIPNPA